MQFDNSVDLLKAYNEGFVGSYCDPKDIDKLLGELPHPLFGAAAYGIVGSGKGKLALPFLNLLKFDPGFGPAERQTEGSCVAHGTRGAVDITRACEIIGGDREEFVARGAIEGIYGCRGHGGEGMSCSVAARFVNKTGGILLRRNYGKYDLSKYNGRLASGWGRSGVPEELLREAQKNQVKTISLVNTIEQARDAIANGYAINVCSGSGFSSTRDQYGIASRSGRWNHAMCWCGVDDTHEIYDETLFLIQNSWGVWNGGPKRHNQPDGSFWIRERDAAEMLSQNGSWVFSDVDGFPARKVLWTLDSVF